jgi:hypothetical protein
MALSLLTIVEELEPFVEEWKSDLIDKSWRVTADLYSDRLMLSTDNSSWPFVSREEIYDFGPSAEALAGHFSERAKSIMAQDRDIKVRLRGKTYSIAS